MPYIEKNYRVLTDRSNTAIAGLSMGGNHALQVGIPHLNGSATSASTARASWVRFRASGRTSRCCASCRAGRRARHDTSRARRCSSGRAASADSCRLGNPERRHAGQRQPQKGAEGVLVRDRQGRWAHHDDQRLRRTLQEARVQPRHERDARRPHLDQLARLPQRVRADVVSVVVRAHDWSCRTSVDC